MVHTDGRKAYGLHRHGGGGVVVPAEPGLHDHEVHARLGEGEQAERRQKFKVGTLRRGLHDAVGETGPRRLGQHFAVDADAFARGHEVGRGVEPHLEPVRAGDAGQKGGRGTLAVGPYHLRGHEGRREQAERGQGVAHAVKSEIHVEKPEGVEVILYVVESMETHGMPLR